jgi:hypothetical protein
MSDAHCLCIRCGSAGPMAVGSIRVPGQEGRATFSLCAECLAELVQFLQAKQPCGATP